MPFTAENDNSKEKRERRRTTYKMAKRRHATNILATNFPEQSGRKFVHKLARVAPVTLCERKSFTRVSKQELSGVCTLISDTDVFYQMLSNQYDFLDLDLCGGLSEGGARSIMSCLGWKTIVLTVSDKFRSKWGAKSANGKTHIQTWIMELCEKNNWGCQLSFSPAPYKRETKNERLGIPDGRGPWYYTFVITRN